MKKRSKWLGLDVRRIDAVGHSMSVSYTLAVVVLLPVAFTVSTSPTAMFACPLLFDCCTVLKLAFARWVSEPLICWGAAICRPIFCNKFDSLPVFFNNRSGAGGTTVNVLFPLCSCCNLAYCSCNAFCFFSNSWCLCSNSSFLLPFFAPSCEFTLSQLLLLLVDIGFIFGSGSSLFTCTCRFEPMFLGSVCDFSFKLDRPGTLRRSVPSPKFCVAASNCDIGLSGWLVAERGGKLGEVGDARGLFELVRGGGGGGTRRPEAKCCRSSAFRSGIGGLFALEPRWRGWIGGLLSVSEPLGYEWSLRRLPVAVLTVRFCTGSNVAESILPFRPISPILGVPILYDAAWGSWVVTVLGAEVALVGCGLEKVWSSSNRASSAFSGRWLLSQELPLVESPPMRLCPMTLRAEGTAGGYNTTFHHSQITQVNSTILHQ